MSENSLSKIKSACALIEMKLEDTVERGTGYLIAKDLMITCEHVVSHASDDTVINLTFGNGDISTAKLIAKNVAIDCAVLRLAEAVDITPLRIVKNYLSNEEEAKCKVYGFPANAGQTGIPLNGILKDSNGLDNLGRSSLQLSFPEAKDEQVHGFSGSPVILGEAVIGHLKRIIARRQELEFGNSATLAAYGILFATKAEEILNYLEELKLIDQLKVHKLAPQPAGVGYDKDWYIPRYDEEELAIDRLNQASGGVVILGPFHSGKSTFLSCLLDRVRKDDLQQSQTSKEIMLHVNELSYAKSQSIDELLKAFAILLVNAVDGAERWIDECWTSPNAQINLRRLMTTHIFSDKYQRFILIIDGTELISTWRAKDDFFGMLRSWLQRRDDAWPKLRLILTLSIPPSELISDNNQSPFNICEIVRMQDFTLTQMSELLNRYDLDWLRTEISLLRDQVGGHPHLVREIMYHTKKYNKDLQELLKPEGQIINKHLNACRNRCNEIFDKSSIWKAELAKIKNGSSKAQLNEDICIRLEHLGIIESITGKYSLRYPIYECLID